MARYDEDVIQRFANKLYARANSIVAAYILLFMFVGAGVGFGLAGGGGGGVGAGQGDVAIIVFPALLGLLGAVIGLWLGGVRAFSLRLQAQMALCQVAIERNTRSS